MCGSCGVVLPWRLPTPLAVASVALAALLLAVGLQVAGARSERRELESESRAMAAARAGQVEETLALLGSLEESRARPIRQALLSRLVSEFSSVAGEETAVVVAHGRADRLIATHGESWPALVEALEPVVARLRVQREVARLLVPLRSEAGQAGLDLDAYEARLRAAGTEARRLGDLAARELSRGVRPAWDEAVVSLARSEARAGRVLAAGGILERVFPLPASRDAIAVRPLREGAVPVGSPQAQISALEDAHLARDLDGLRLGVRARAGLAWPADSVSRLERALPVACRALASLAAEAAREAEEPERRVELLLDAVTCDELLPPSFLVEARAAIAEGRIVVAERGGILPPPVSVGGRGDWLVRLSCAAQAAGSFSVAREALRLVESEGALEAGLACGSWEAPELRTVRATWPALDYPRLSGPIGEELP